VSAVATEPRRALAHVAIRTRAAPLVLLVAGSAGIRMLAAWLRPTPDYFPDEYMYATFSRSIAAGHLPTVRGVPAHFLPLVEPLLTAPAWLLPTLQDGYRAVQAIDAVAMSLAAIPVYWLARRVGLGSRPALAAAALSLTMPSLIYSSFVISEPFAYPIMLGAVAAGVHALDRPGARSYALFLACAAVGMFTRMQFAVLLPCFVLALAIVLVRERRIREFVRTYRSQLALMILVSAGLLALGPARNTGYYPSFTFVPTFGAMTALRVAAADALVLVFSSGFVLVPGALMEVVHGIARARVRVELAFAALTVALTVGLFAEAVVYGHPTAAQAQWTGHSDYVQQRYLFYLVPLWTISFLLYAQRGWPRRTTHALVALAFVVAALRLPLAGYIVGDQFQHSAFLFGLRRLAELMTSTSNASLAIVVAAAVATALVLATVRLVPRYATALAVSIAIAGSVAASVGATSLDVGNTRAIYNSELDGRPTWVDDANVGKAELLLLPGAAGAESTLFWNRSVDRLALFHAADAPDPFAADEARVASDGTVLVGGRPLRGAVVLNTNATSVELEDGTTLASTFGNELVRPAGDLRFRLMIVGRFADGALGGAGVVTIWPTTPDGSISGRLVLPLRPRTGGEVTVRFTSRRSAHAVVRHALPGRMTNVVVPVCSRGPVVLDYRATPVASVADGRLVAATAGAPRFVAGPAGC
jgi:4-amino-4-deoxy-L-arabinose transferase-like glycosyltransferase